MPAELLAIDDPAFREIVGCHFNVNSVAHDRTNAKAAHFPGGIGDDPILIIEQNPEPAIRQNFVDNSLDGEQFFFRQSLSVLVRRDGPRGRLVASWR